MRKGDVPLETPLPSRFLPHPPPLARNCPLSPPLGPSPFIPLHARFSRLTSPPPLVLSLHYDVALMSQNARGFTAACSIYTRFWPVTPPFPAILGNRSSRTRGVCSVIGSNRLAILPKCAIAEFSTLDRDGQGTNRLWRTCC